MHRNYVTENRFSFTRHNYDIACFGDLKLKLIEITIFGFQ